MDFNAPDINYAGISPIIALTAGLVLTLLAGLVGGSRRRQGSCVSIVGSARSPPPPGSDRQWGDEKDLVAGALRLDDLALAASLLAIARRRVRASRSPGASSRSTGPSGPPATASSRRC